MNIFRMKVIVYSTKGYDRSYLKKAGAEKHEFIFTEKGLTLETVFLANGCEAIALFTSDDASKEVLQKLSENGVKYIALRSAGHDHVDLKKAKELNIIMKHSQGLPKLQFITWIVGRRV